MKAVSKAYGAAFIFMLFATDFIIAFQPVLFASQGLYRCAKFLSKNQRSHEQYQSVLPVTLSNYEPWR